MYQEEENMSNEDREAIKYTINHLDRVEAELQKLRRALIAQLNGEEFNEEFDDEISGLTNDLAEMEHNVVLIIVSILDLKFANSEYGHYEEWRHEWINKFIDSSTWLSVYTTSNSSISLIGKALQTEIDELYKEAVDLFLDQTTYIAVFTSNDYMLPEVCPWTIEELSTKNIQELKNMI